MFMLSNLIELGSKKTESGSLAIVIPAEITREFHIDRSTIFFIHADEKAISLKIHTVKIVKRLPNIVENTIGESHT